MNQYPKRLIEVDLPIKEISAHARRIAYCFSGQAWEEAVKKEVSFNEGSR